MSVSSSMRAILPKISKDAIPPTKNGQKGLKIGVLYDFDVRRFRFHMQKVDEES